MRFGQLTCKNRMASLHSSVESQQLNNTVLGDLNGAGVRNEDQGSALHM